MKNIFISSTFKDMQEERNIIHTQVMPNVNNSLQTKGIYANFIDFRWGIDTENLSEELSIKRVLETCFDALRKCEYLIVFIGDNYGSCVPKDVIKELEQSVNFQTENNDKSITELEVAFATNNGLYDSKNTLFYFKESNSSYDKRVKELRQRIEKLFPTQVKKYNKVDERFAEKITKDILAMVDDNPHVFFRELTTNITEENASHFSGRKALLSKTAEDVLHNPFTVIFGKSGMGKSVFMSSLKKELDSFCYTEILYINKVVYNYKAIPQCLLDFVENAIVKDYPQLNIKYKDDFEYNITSLFLFINQTEDVKDFVFLIDGIDKFDSTGITETLSSLKVYSKKLHFVISLDDSNKYVFPQEPYLVHLKGLCNSDKRKTIEKELEINHKTLTDECKQLLIEKKESDYPLYLVLAIKRLVYMQESDYNEIYSNDNVSFSINNFIKNTIKGFSDDLENMIIDYLEFAGKIVDEQLAINIITYLAVSEEGFSDTDLYFLIDRHCKVFWGRPNLSIRGHNWVFVFDGEQLSFKPSDLEFYLLFRYLGDLLAVNNSSGKTRFENNVIKKAINTLYHGNIFINSISSELFFDPKDRILPDFEICVAALKSITLNANPQESPYGRRAIYYLPFIIIDSAMKSRNMQQIDQFATILYNLFVDYGETLLKAYLEQAKKYRKRRDNDVEKAINSFRFIINFLIPKLSKSLINPLPFVPYFEEMLSFLQYYMDYTFINNRLYLIMARLNIAIMCYNTNNQNKALEISNHCKYQLYAIPKAMRNDLYYEAIQSFEETIKDWKG